MEKKATSAGRAWRILRMALLWARKGGAFRRWRLMLGLRIALKSLRHGGAGSGARAAERIRCMERQLSFDETPTFGFRMRSRRPATSLRFPMIPCIGTAPSVHLDDDDDDEGSDWIFYKGEKECEFFRGDQENEDQCSSTENYDDDGDGDDEESESECENSGEDVAVEELEGIDSKAEEFISNFYEQMKLQRQVSLIQYDEMLRRGVS